MENQMGYQWQGYGRFTWKDGLGYLAFFYGLPIGIIIVCNIFIN